MHILKGCVILVGLFLGSEANPCSNYIQLDNVKRSTAYDMKASDTSIHDWYIIVEGNWHRFRSNGYNVEIPERIPGKAVQARHCGTQSPIWIKGNNTHPTGPAEVNATVCTTYGLSACDWSATIRIRRCTAGDDDYYVYWLARPQSTNIAYCAGEEMTCPHGKWYNQELKECTNISSTAIPPATTPPPTSTKGTTPTATPTKVSPPVTTTKGTNTSTTIALTTAKVSITKSTSISSNTPPTTTTVSRTHAASSTSKSSTKKQSTTGIPSSTSSSTRPVSQTSFSTISTKMTQNSTSNPQFVEPNIPVKANRIKYTLVGLALGILGVVIIVLYLYLSRRKQIADETKKNVFEESHEVNATEWNVFPDDDKQNIPAVPYFALKFQPFEIKEGEFGSEIMETATELFPTSQK